MRDILSQLDAVIDSLGTADSSRCSRSPREPGTSNPLIRQPVPALPVVPVPQRQECGESHLIDGTNHIAFYQFIANEKSAGDRSILQRTGTTGRAGTEWAFDGNINDMAVPVEKHSNGNNGNGTVAQDSMPLPARSGFFQVFEDHGLDGLIPEDWEEATRLWLAQGWTGCSS